MSDRTGFTLTDAQWVRVKEWEAVVWPKAIKKSKRPGVHMADGRLAPEYGCVGGGVTFTFMPTSLGTVCTVKEAITGEELILDEDFG